MNKFLALFMLFFMISCESDSDGSCSSDQWVGTYTIESEIMGCNSTLTVAVVSGNTISLNSVEGKRDGCTFSAPTFQTEATLSGSTITFSGLGCTATYNKN